jgi:hypothetical protein
LKMVAIKVNWNHLMATGIDSALRRFERRLADHGYRGVHWVVLRADKAILEETGSTTPALEEAKEWHGYLAESKLDGGTVNIRDAALKVFYKSERMEPILPCLKVSNKVPFLQRGWGSSHPNAPANLKHFTMSSPLLCCLLRAGDLIDLEDEDADLKTMSLKNMGGGGSGSPRFCQYQCGWKF